MCILFLIALSIKICNILIFNARLSTKQQEEKTEKLEIAHSHIKTKCMSQSFCIIFIFRFVPFHFTPWNEMAKLEIPTRSMSILNWINYKLMGKIANWQGGLQYMFKQIMCDQKDSSRFNEWVMGRSCQNDEGEKSLM